jgi:hypothetical protein
MKFCVFEIPFFFNYVILVLFSNLEAKRVKNGAKSQETY